MNPGAQHDVFLSYARGENAERVQVLDSGLRAAGLSVWRDTTAMPSRGLSFLEEIRRAIRTARRVVVAISPKAVRSEYVRMEWQYALSADRIVVPVLFTREYSLVPPELRKLHTCVVEDVTDLAELIRILRAEDPPLGILHGVPKPPPHYRPRPDALSELAAHVLADHEAPEVLDEAEKRTVVYGMGGSGKTVLAAAFARGAPARRTFAGGIFWFNQRAGLTGQAVAEAMQAQFTDGTLSDQACLVVLDNVDSPRFVEPVDRLLGRDSRIIVTTRDRRIADTLGAGRVSVDDLPLDKGLEYLADWTGTPLADLPDAARSVVQATGGNMLALTLAGAFLASSDGAYGDLLSGLADAHPELMDRDLIGYEYDGVMRSINASVARLSEPGRAVLADLIVIPAGAAMPVSVIKRLSGANGLTDYQVTAALTELAGLRLVQAEAGEISLHDLQRLYLRATCPDPAAAHARLLDAHGPPDTWNPASAEPYLYEFLSEHLVHAGRRPALLELLTSSPAWMRTSLVKLHDVRPFRADVQRALEGDRTLVETVRLQAAYRAARTEASRYSADELRCLVRLGDAELATSCARFGTFGHRLAVLDETSGQDTEFLREVIEGTRLVKDGAERGWRQAALMAIPGAADELLPEFQHGVEMIEYVPRRRDILGEAAIRLMRTGRFADARVMCDLVDDASQRANLTADEAICLAGAGRLADARDILPTLPARMSAPVMLAILEAEKRNGAPQPPAELEQLLRVSKKRKAPLAASACAIPALKLWPDYAPLAKTLTSTLKKLASADQQDRFVALRMIVAGLTRVGTPASVDLASVMLRHWDAWLNGGEWVPNLYPLREEFAMAAGWVAAGLVRQDQIDAAARLGSYDKSGQEGLTVADAVALEAAKLGHPRARALFQDAVATSDRADHAASRPRLFGAVAMKLPQRREPLLALAQEQSRSHPQALFDIAGALGRAGRFDEAYAVALSIDHSRLGTAACGNVILELFNAGQDEKARRLLAGLVKRSLQQDMGAQIQLIRLGDALAAQGRLAESLTVGVTASGDELPRRRIRAHLASGDFDAALAEARATPASEQPGWLSSIAARVAPSDSDRARVLFDEAVISARGDDTTLLSIVPDLASSGFLDEAASVARTIGSPAQRSMAWSVTAKVGLERRAAVPREWLLHAEEALASAPEAERDKPLRFLANATITYGLDPMPVLARIADEATRTETLADIAGIEAFAGRLQAALDHYPREGLEAWLDWIIESSMEVFREAAPIAGWVSPNWKTLCTVAWPTTNDATDCSDNIIEGK
jgi:TIR domain/NB-ARC domain